MRLTPEQTRDLAGPNAAVRLFGSRLRDDLRGGDIDLLVECPQPVQRPAWLAAMITARLQRALGDRRIDVLMFDPDTPVDAVHRVALAAGILLGP